MKIVKIILTLVTSCVFHIYATVTNPNIRVGLDTQVMECTAVLDGGGEVQDLAGETLFRLKSGERLRIWLDGNINVNSANEFRIQIGPPSTIQEADAIIQKLQIMNKFDKPEKIAVPDGGSWRVLFGHFKDSKDTEPTLDKLRTIGYQELWIVTEVPIANTANSGYILYAITENYERHLLPNGGIRLISVQNLTTIIGKGRYRGLMEIRPNINGKLSVINVVDLESYLRGVVPMEMSSGNFPELEALKAQAVAARTYAFTNLGKRAKCGFDLVNTISDQVYGGRDKEQILTDRAVMETAGLIATYNGSPIQALFMANAGGSTVDNSFVFGGACNYLKEASNYAKKPQTITFTSKLGSKEGGWLTWEILRLVGKGLLPISYLESGKMNSIAQASDLYPILKALTSRLGQPHPSLSEEIGPSLYLWMGRSLGFQDIASGIEHHQDALYMLGEDTPVVQDKLLASFLTRRGLVSPTAWRDRTPTIAQSLQILGKLWYELEPVDFMEGTLLRNGEVRVGNCGSNVLMPKVTSLLIEEAPGGSLRIIGSSNIQVGDRIKWLPNISEDCTILVRRLDPNGTAINRYSPTAHWKVELKEIDLLEALRTKANVQSLKDIKLTYNDKGRVVEMNVTDDAGQSHRFTGMRIRNLLGLRDNIFRFITIGNRPFRRWIIYGRGWGHGVGMDQTGAYGMALEGADFREILQHYYQGIQFTTIGS